jgi:hypothetical protein
MATAPPPYEMQVIRDCLISIPEVEQVYVRSTPECVKLMIVLPDMGPATQMRLCAREAELIDKFPDTEFDFEVIFRCGRPRHDVVSPQGLQLFPAVED